MEFEKLQLKNNEKTKDIIKKAFDMELPVEGGWGYTKEDAVIIKELSMPLSQLQFVFATVRATLQMNLTQPTNNRFAGINVKEIKKEKIDEYEKVTFLISAIKENIYKKFIDEYKKNYSNPEFDIENHFKKREENTLKIQEDFWFKVPKS